MSFKETYIRVKTTIGERVPVPSPERKAYLERRAAEKATRVDGIHVPADGTAIDPADPWIGGDWGADPPDIQELDTKADNHMLWKTDGAVLEQLPFISLARHTRRTGESASVASGNEHLSRSVIDAPKADQVLTLYDQDHGRITPPRPTIDLGSGTKVRTVYVPIRVQPPAGIFFDQDAHSDIEADTIRPPRSVPVRHAPQVQYRQRTPLFTRPVVIHEKHVVSHHEAPAVLPERVSSLDRKIRQVSSGPHTEHEVRNAIRSFSAEAVEAQKKGVKVLDVITARNLYMHILENVGADHATYAEPDGAVKQIVKDLSRHVYGEKLKKIGDNEKKELTKIAHIINTKFGHQYKEAAHGIGKRGVRKEFLKVVVDGYRSALELSQKLNHTEAPHEHTA